MTAADKWGIIVSKYKENFDAQESVIETTWEKIFAELFGYSILMGEIKRQHNVPVAHTNVRIDMVVGNNFVVEVKRHKDAAGEAEKKQLFDYMKLLGLKVGILICDKIHIYDGQRDGLQIPFEADHADGVKFVDIFTKTNFNVGVVGNWLTESAIFALNVEDIRHRIGPELIERLLREHFSGKYSQEEIKQALSELVVSIKNLQVYAHIKGIISQKTAATTIPKRIIKKNYNRLKKADAIKICKEGGKIFDDKAIRFANKLNNGTYNFDPNKKQLEDEGFWLLLSNEEFKEIYVFNVDAGIIPAKDEWLNTNENLYKLRVNDDGANFIEVRSGIDLWSFFVETIKY